MLLEMLQIKLLIMFLVVKTEIQKSVLVLFVVGACVSKKTLHCLMGT